jgi:hypothetical protein
MNQMQDIPANCRQNRAESSSSLKWWRNKGLETGGQHQPAQVNALQRGFDATDR